MLNHLQFLCQFQDVDSQHELSFDDVHIFIHSTLKPDEKHKTQQIPKIPVH